MKRSLFFALIFSIGFFGCKNSTDANNTGTGLPGTLYYYIYSLSSFDGVYKLDLSSGNNTPVKIAGHIQFPNVLANGWILGSVFDGTQNTLGEISPDGAQSKTILKPFPAYAGNMQASSDGKYIAYDDGEVLGERVYVVDANTGAQLFVFGDGKQETYSSPCWSPDSKTLYLAGESGNYGIYSSDLAVIADVNTTLNHPQHPKVSPDGKKLAFILNDGNIWTMNVDGTGANQITTGSSTESYPVWSPDGKWIAAYTNSGQDFIAVQPGTTNIVNFRDVYSIFQNNNYIPSTSGQFDWK